MKSFKRGQWVEFRKEGHVWDKKLFKIEAKVESPLVTEGMGRLKLEASLYKKTKDPCSWTMMLSIYDQIKEEESKNPTYYQLSYGNRAIPRAYPHEIVCSSIDDENEALLQAIEEMFENSNEEEQDAIYHSLANVDWGTWWGDDGGYIPPKIEKLPTKNKPEKNKRSHKDHKTVWGVAAGEKYLYCRDCKVEVNPKTLEDIDDDKEA